MKESIDLSKLSRSELYFLIEKGKIITEQLYHRRLLKPQSEKSIKEAIQKWQPGIKKGGT